MSTLLKMQKFHPLCSRCIGMYPLQNRWTVLRYLQCYENFSECCTHLILPETALFSPTPTFAKEPIYHTSFATGEIVQEYSHHSYPDGGTNLLNYNRDVPGENVLISNNYWYWGREAIKIPSQLLKLAAVKRGHRVFENAAFVSEVDKWLNELNYSGYIGKPCKFSSDYQWYDGRK